ncbi:MAG: hypothetical protein IT561_25970, partial [Alphaproteobacteria bacterium]|nr:hypothetical protein [Alphaproteobacteria bacterium]
AASQLLWLQHTLDAFRHAGDAIAAVVDYDDWFEAPVATAYALMARLGLEWPADDATLAHALATMVRPDLRHGRAAAPARLMPEVRELHALLRAAAPDAPPRRAVADLLARFDDAHRLMGAWGEVVAGQPAREAALAAIVAEAERARADGERERAGQAARIAQQETRAEAYARDHAALQDLYADLDRRRLAAEAEAAALTARIAERDAMIAAGEAERARLAAEVATRQRLLDQVMPDPARALDEVWNSTSLRLVRPLQRLLAGRHAVARPECATPEEQVRAVVRLQDSAFWDLTGPVRAAARLIRGGRNR